MDQNGKRIKKRKTVKASGIREAKKLLTQFGAAILAGYDRIIKGRTHPELGHMKLDKVKLLQILGFLEKLKQDGARGDSKSRGDLQDLFNIIVDLKKHFFTSCRMAIN